MSNWWPLGTDGVALARAVLEGRTDDARQMAEAWVKADAERKEYDEIVARLYAFVDDCAWDEAEACISQLERRWTNTTVGFDLVRHQTMLAFERAFEPSPLEKLAGQADDTDAG